jgi:hypothetical protein
MMSRNFSFLLAVLCLLGTFPQAVQAQSRKGTSQRGAAAQGERKAKRPAPRANEEPAAATPDYVAEAEQARAEGRTADAVQALLKADDQDRSMALLGRAFELAGQLDDPLLMVQVAERILSRAEVSDEGRSLARKAVARASDRLTQLELVCAERHCNFEVDGQAAIEGISYWMPGTHEIRLAGRPDTSRSVSCRARAICRLSLPSSDAGVAGAPVDVLSPAESQARPEAAGRSAALETAQTDLESPVDRSAKSSASKAPLAVLISASVGAVALGSLSVWSGVKALQARNVHDSNPAAYDRDEVELHARRTDYFMLGAGLCAGLAVATAVWWVDWDARRSTKVSLGASSILATHKF